MGVRVRVGVAGGEARQISLDMGFKCALSQVSGACKSFIP